MNRTPAPTADIKTVQHTIKKNLRRILGFLVLGVCLTVLIFYLTGNRQTLAYLRNFSWPYLPLTLAMVVAAWYLHGLKLSFIARGMDEKPPLNSVVGAILLSDGIRNLVPVLGAGEMLRIIFLKRAGLPVEKAGVMVWMAEAVFDFMISIMFLFLALVFSDPLALGGGDSKILHLTRTVFPAVISAGLALILFFAFVLLFRPDWIAKLAGRLLNLRPVVWLLKKERADRYREKLSEFFIQFKVQGRSLLAPGRLRYLAASFAAGSVQYAIRFSFVTVLALGFGISVNVWDFIFWITVIATIIVFMPTPGGWGPAEVLFSSIFIGLVPLELVGVLMLAWRFCTHYITIVMAGLIWARRAETP